jgi:uncharacterized protein YjbI with pentapeptide repeats
MTRNCRTLLVLFIFMLLSGCSASSNEESLTSPTDQCAQSIDPPVDAGKSVEAEFWADWCAKGIQQLLEQAKVSLPKGETWKSYANSVAVYVCEEIGAAIELGYSAYDAQLNAENQLSYTLLDETSDFDRRIQVKSAALSIANSAVAIVCPQNQELETDTTELAKGSGTGCTVEGISRNAECPGVTLPNADFSNRDLFGVDLSGSILSNANFSGAELSFANMSNAELTGANFEGAGLFEADFSGATMNNANLNSVDAESAKFIDASLSQATMIGSILHYTDFSGADLSRIIGFSRDSGEVRKAAFNGAKLNGADLSNAYFPGVWFRSVNLSGANLSGTDLREAYFECANLEGVVVDGQTNAIGATYNGSTISSESLYGMVRRGDNEMC